MTAEWLSERATSLQSVSPYRMFFSEVRPEGVTLFLSSSFISKKTQQ